MEAKDLIVTPFVILIVMGLAYLIRSLVTNAETRRYFIPALALKIIGAISLGLIYEFYYGSGDTLNYYYHGTQHIWEAFLDHPSKAFQLIFANGTHRPETFEYSSQIWFFRDLPSYFVIRVGALFGLLTFHTYSAMAVLFACFSFSGGWAMYNALLKFYPNLHRYFALAIFFIPSVVFWGSGMMKDTLTLGALCWLVWGVVGLFFEQKKLLQHGLVILLMAVIIYSVKIYIIMCLLPALILWLGFDRFSKIRRIEWKVVLLPLVLVIMVGVSLITIREVGAGNNRYSVENLGNAAEVTARWINYVSEKEGGAGYTLGDFDYSPIGIARKFFPAIFVTLFQPFLWQADSPVVLLSALESLGFLLLTFWVIKRAGLGLIPRLLQYNAVFVFALVFSLAFAAAVGFSTYNFGSLVRYKIPLLPFYGMVLALLWHYSNRERKVA